MRLFKICTKQKQKVINEREGSEKETNSAAQSRTVTNSSRNYITIKHWLLSRPLDRVIATLQTVNMRIPHRSATHLCMMRL